MKSIKGSETEKNLLKAFAGESQARNRYTYFASTAKHDGYEQISAIFLETAENEKEHAKVFFKFLEGGMAEITATYPAGKMGKTTDNLLAAAEGEKMEWGKIYPEFEKTARKEGFDDVAKAFKEIAEVEQQHEKKIQKAFGKCQNKHCLQEKPDCKMEMQKLRIYSRRKRRSIEMSCMQSSAGIL